MKQTWPAPERNKQPILEVLARVLPARGRVLELSSGSGQHAGHFAQHLPALHFMPSDIESNNLASISAWVQELALPNLAEPLQLDVCAPDYGVGQVEAMFNANMIHIAPWSCAEGLFAGAGRHLLPSGVLVLYGPFHVGGQPTSPSNATFDQDLRERNPSWGVRDLEAVSELADSAQLLLEERVAMPANNQLLVFRKRLTP
jgi:hypothetical protein